MQENKNKKMRLVVDANAWISSLITPGFRVRLDIVFEAAYHLMVCEEFFTDLANAIRKPRVEKRINRKTYDTLVSLLRNDAELVDVHSVVDVCRDPKDNFLLALAKDGNADYLPCQIFRAGDKDLRVMEKFGKTEIVTLSEFEAMASERSRKTAPGR